MSALPAADVGPLGILDSEGRADDESVGWRAVEKLDSAESDVATDVDDESAGGEIKDAAVEGSELSTLVVAPGVGCEANAFIATLLLPLVTGAPELAATCADAGWCCALDAARSAAGFVSPTTDTKHAAQLQYLHENMSTTMKHCTKLQVIVVHVLFHAGAGGGLVAVIVVGCWLLVLFVLLFWLPDTACAYATGGGVRNGVSGVSKLHHATKQQSYCCVTTLNFNRAPSNFYWSRREIIIITGHLLLMVIASFLVGVMGIGAQLSWRPVLLALDPLFFCYEHAQTAPVHCYCYQINA